MFLMSTSDIDALLITLTIKPLSLTHDAKVIKPIGWYIG
jgi:hypothetical protein